MVSPEVQRTAITDYCTSRGYQVVEWLEGIDESGSRSRSAWWPRLEQGVGMVESGRVERVVVWKFSRTARNRLRWAIALDRVEAAGGQLESATEQVDASTSTGRFTRGMLAELNAFEAERIGEVWKEVHSRRTVKGVPANGKPRFGYRNIDGVLQPDPVTGPVLGDLYRRYVAGESIYMLTGWLNSEGHRTIPGYSKRGPGPWTQTTLRRCLDAGFGAGFITVHGQQIPGSHEPVISPDLWARFLTARAGRRTSRGTERSQYLLSGLVRCGCGSPMGGGQFGTNRTAKFRCVAAASERRHTGGYVTMRLVEEKVLDWLRTVASDVNEGADAELARQGRVERRKRDVRLLAREILALDRQLTSLTVDKARGIVPESAYVAARDEITTQRDSLSLQLAQAETETVDPGTVAADLLAGWVELPVEQRRAALRGLIRHVVVTAGRPRATLRVVPVWVR
jgi:DNA invertase Pin-like site-specific DNA recombinase